MDEIVASDLHGRIGKISLPKGEVVTPTLLPVIDPKENIIPPQDMIDKFGFNFVITSAYLYFKRFGMPSSSDDIHKILDFKGNIMMDSGAYQVLVYGDVEIDPIQSLTIQTNLKTDVGVILDVPTPPTDTYTQAKEKVEETIRRVGISLPYVDSHPETIWTLPIQGGKNIHLLEKYIQTIKQKKYLNSFNFHALGSVAPIMSQYDFISLFSMIKTSRELLPHNIPFHLFGAGHPMIFPFVVALGCDTFDSAAYILYAKKNRYMTTSGTYHLSDLAELPCSCEICSKWSPKELLELDDKSRIRNVALHNLYVSQAEIKNIKVSINDGNLWELLERRSKSHPALYRAFKFIIDEFKGDFLEYATPVTKQIGLKIYDEDSFYRPEYTRARARLYRSFKPDSSKLVIIVSSGRKNPTEFLYSRPDIKKNITNLSNKYDFAFLVPFIGLLPVELVETFPFSQYVFSAVISEEMLSNLWFEVGTFIAKMKYEENILCSVGKEEETKDMLYFIQSKFKEGKIPLKLKSISEL